MWLTLPAQLLFLFVIYYLGKQKSRIGKFPKGSIKVYEQI